MTDAILTVGPAVRTGPVQVLAVTGEIDYDSREVLRAAATDALTDGATSLVLDLTGVSFCDSGGLSLFVDLHRLTEARGGTLRLAGTPSRVLSVIRATNLDRLLGMDATVEDALRGAPPAG